MLKSKVIKWIGRIFMILSFIFIGKTLWGYRGKIQINISVPVIIGLCVCTIIYGILVYMLAFIYQKLLIITTKKKFPYYKIAYLYCKTAIFKYMPGNVMQYVGRNQLAIEENISHIDVAVATLLEITVTILSAALLSLIFSAKYAAQWIENNSIHIGMIFQIGLAVIVIFWGAVWISRKRLNKILHKYIVLINRANIKIYIGTICYNMVITIINSLIYFSVLLLLGMKLEWNMYLAGIGLYALSFLLGYITPGVPGGIGIREAILTYFFSGVLMPGEILSGALVFRVVSIVGDGIGYMISLIVKKRLNTIHGG